MTDLLQVENDKIVRSSIRNYAQSAKENILYFFLKLTKDKRRSTIMIMLESSEVGGGGGARPSFSVYVSCKDRYRTPCLLGLQFTVNIKQYR